MNSSEESEDKLYLLPKELWRCPKTRKRYVAPEDKKIPIECYIVGKQGKMTVVAPQAWHRITGNLPYNVLLSPQKVAAIKWRMRTSNDGRATAGIAVAEAVQDSATEMAWMDNIKINGHPIPPRSEENKPSQSDKRNFIAFTYKIVYNSAEKEYWWGPTGVINQLAKLSGCHRDTVHRLLMQVKYDGSIQPIRRKRGTSLTYNDIYFFAQQLLAGASAPVAATMTNLRRRQRGEEFRSVATYKRQAKIKFGATGRRRRTAPLLGNAEWRERRLAQCQLFLYMLVHMLWTLDMFLFVDEKHFECKYGINGKYEFVMDVNPDNPLEPMEGGVRSPPRPECAPKHPNQCRGMFGVMKKLVDGQYQGFKMAPMQYNNLKVLGPKSYRDRVNEHLRTVRASDEWKNGKKKWKDVPVQQRNDPTAHPYKVAYPDEWKEKMNAAIGIINVTDMMDHCITEGNKLFEDTPYKDRWMLWHDALPQWWSKEAQVRRRQ